jgi:phosphoribosylamine--glycine ligase
VFQAGVKRSGSSLVTDGGRVLCVTALGDDITQARTRAYSAFERIRWDGKFGRSDIGSRRTARAR